MKFLMSSDTQVRGWECIYYEDGREVLFRDNRGQKKMTDESKTGKPKLDKKVEEDLKAENQRLRMENACLKKLNALVRESVQRLMGVLGLKSLVRMKKCKSCKGEMGKSSCH